MALFRSIPHEVEAVQFTGMDEDMIPTFSEGLDTLPRWAVKVMFRPEDHGIQFAGSGRDIRSDLWLVNSGNWIIYGMGGGIRVVTDAVMQDEYIPARKRLYGVKDEVKPEQPAPEHAAPADVAITADYDMYTPDLDVAV